MHILQIEISNFKSFKDKTILSFHKNSNVIVGKNGSGKSNLITALEFIICCPKIEPQDRKNYIHEGEGDCKIEIIFDNSLQRIKDKNIIIVSRLINLNSDSFYLNSKLITREEVKGLFESGGIPITSPYFMVQQGKINSLINLSNEQRYNLIKSIAGISKYEEDREKSLRMLEETQQTQSKVEGILERIMGKLEGLEKDKEILEENEELEKEKRRYEIGYKQREILEINEKIEGGYRDGVVDGRDGGDHVGYKGVDGRIGGQGRDYGDNKDHGLNTDNHNESMYLDDLHVEFELQQIRKKITQNLKFTNNTLTNNPPPSYESKITLLSNQLKDLNEKKLKIKEIYEKNLIELEGLKKLKREVDKKGVLNDEDIILMEKEIQNLSKNINKHKDNNDQPVFFNLNSLKSLVDKRNELWREEKNLKNELKGIEEELKWRGCSVEGGSKVEKGVGNMGDNLNLEGTPNNPKGTPTPHTPIPHTPLQKGVLLLDLFDIPEDLIPAFESVAGPHLFSIVIENESLIPSLPYKDCTYIPLNRMFYKEAPLLENEELFLLSKKIKINVKEYCIGGNDKDGGDLKVDNDNHNIPYLASLLRFITKNSFVSSDIKSSSYFSKKYKINVVTLDGDFFSRTGVITGGFNEKKKNLIEYKRNTKKKKEIEGKIEKNKKEIEKINKEIEIKSSEGDYDQGNQGRGKDNGNIDAKQDSNPHLNSNLMGNPPHLNTLIRIAFLNYKISYLKNPNSIKFNEIQNFELKIGAIKGEDEVLLENINFIKERLKKYKQKYIHEQCISKEDPINNGDIEYLRCKEKSLADFLKRKNILKIEKLEDLELEKERAKRHVFYGKRLTLMKEIGLENYKEIDLIYPELSKEDLILKLKEIKSKLKKFDFINKRALTQWNSHLEQKDTLKTRLKELKETLKKIKEFIKELDGKKERFLEFTFEMVRNNFKGFSKRMIFEMDIVKGSGGGSDGRMVGEGRLEGGSKIGDLDKDMKDTNLEDHNLSNLNNTPPSSLIITHNNLPLDLNLLSGGQKTMIALCLIFSIQKIDPSPFYIFDEADANLDKQSREKITDLFKEIIQEEDVQLIITTFKEELVECGNKFIGVSFKEKKSYLGEVSKEIVNEFMRE